MGSEMCIRDRRRVEPVVVDAAAPAAQHGAVAVLPACGIAQAEGFDFLDVRGVGLQRHGVESMRAWNVPQGIVCPGPCRAHRDLPIATAALQHAECDRCRTVRHLSRPAAPV